MTLFEYRDYKSFINNALKGRTPNGRGERFRLGQFLGCQSAYITRVLSGDAHFSLEQTEKVNEYLGHNEDQSLYLLMLVQKARAGTKSLEKIFDKQLAKLGEKHFKLKDRLQYQKSITKEDQSLFYSSWQYGAIHILASIPHLQTEKAMGQHLGLPQQKVARICNFLVEMGLLKKKGHGYELGVSHIHLEDESPMIAKHHANWRIRAIQSLDHYKESDLHYSSVMSCAREDVVKIKSIFVKAIEQARAIVKDSKEEAVYSYCLDLFDLQAE